MRTGIILLALALLGACSKISGDLAYQAYETQHLTGLVWVDRSGATLRAPEYAENYTELPHFAAIEDTAARKQAFFEYLRPVIEYRNALNHERRLLLGAVEIRLEYDLPLTKEDEQFLARMRARYRIPQEASRTEAMATLKRRLDEIPDSIVLAQAAIESGWGRSRFAREANNLFGQYCYTPGCGVVPQRRGNGRKHELASFESVDAAIDSYFRNLNTHPMYAPLRDLREEARRADKEISGQEMAAGLERYSERGADYIQEVRQVIRANQLDSVGRG